MSDEDGAYGKQLYTTGTTDQEKMRIDTKTRIKYSCRKHGCQDDCFVWLGLDQCLTSQSEIASEIAVWQKPLHARICDISSGRCNQGYKFSEDINILKYSAPKELSSSMNYKYDFKICQTNKFIISVRK